MAQNWNFNPVTHDYVLGSNGGPEQTDSLLVPAYIRLRTGRGTWLYAQSDQFGSNFYKQKKHVSSQNASLYESLGESALQPMLDDGRAKRITLNATVATRNGIGLETAIVDGRGKEEKFTFNPVRS